MIGSGYGLGVEKENEKVDGVTNLTYGLGDEERSPSYMNAITPGGGTEPMFTFDTFE